MTPIFFLFIVTYDNDTWNDKLTYTLEDVRPKYTFAPESELKCTSVVSTS